TGDAVDTDSGLCWFGNARSSGCHPGGTRGRFPDSVAGMAEKAGCGRRALKFIYRTAAIPSRRCFGDLVGVFFYHTPSLMNAFSRCVGFGLVAVASCSLFATIPGFGAVPPPGKLGSTVFKWEDLTVKPTGVGERRD